MSLKGIDVSRWQGTIDWKKVKAAGIQFAIIKAGGADSSTPYKDSKFEANYKGAKEAGIPVGCYYFNSKQFTTKEKAIEEAKHFCELIKGKQFEFPVFADVEAPLAGNQTAVTNATITFCEYMEDAGYWVGVYSSDVSGYVERLNYDKLKRFTIWNARYYGEDLKCRHEHQIRQYSDKGTVGGISGYVDLDTAYIDYTPLIKARKLNGFSEAQEGSQAAFSIDMPVTLKTYKKSADVQLSPNFKLSEFICKCGKYCSEVTIDLKLVAYLQAIRDHFKAPVSINSGYRCETHNANVGGSRGSYHKKGRAADITVQGVKPAEVAKYAESLGIKGIGLYDTFVHIDTRTTKYFWYSSTEEPRTTFGGTPIVTNQPSTNKTEEKPVDVLAWEVLEGKHGNGDARKKSLGNNYSKVQDLVNHAVGGGTYSGNIEGAYKTTAALHLRADAGTSNKSKLVMPKGTTVKCFGYYKTVGGVKWLHICYLDGKTLRYGFSSSEYLQRV